MDSKQKERILFSLEEIQDRVGLLEGGKNEVINLDIILEEVRIVYREIELLRLKASMPTIKDEAAIKSLPTKVAVEAAQEEKISKQEVSSFSEISKAVAVDPIIENLVVEPLFDLSIPQPAGDLSQSKEVKTKFEKDLNGEKSAQFVADKLKVEDKSLYDRFLLENEDKSVASRLQATPIKSIKDAIGLNEKFLFINELFSGNIQDYNTAIEKLNGFGDANAAFEYLNDLGNTCDWNFERSENTIRTLVNLVQRRYAKS